MIETHHIPVLLEETMLGLNPTAGGVYVDGTLGGGSHTEELLVRSSPDGRVYSFEIYPPALEHAQRRRSRYGSRWMGIEANFAQWSRELQGRGVNEVDGMMLDLGFSSDELNDPEIGISFQQDGVLDMRLGVLANDDGLTAAQVVNTWSPQALADLFFTYADERHARRIAQAIMYERRKGYIVTTKHLAELIVSTVPGGYEAGRIHPATRVFLALRMVVNRELEHLKEAIDGAWDVLKPGGRLAIITFQSIEDRVVKLAFKEGRWEALTKKPLEPSAEECRQNPRARSAKLRVATKLL